MGKPLNIKPEDDHKLLDLKKRTGAKSKVAVLRTALTLLEQDVQRQERIKRWEAGAKIVAQNSLETLSDFSSTTRFKDLPWHQSVGTYTL